MAACKDADSSPDLSEVSGEEVLGLISQGSFRCRPCSNCHNSDPFQMELTQKDPVQNQSDPSRGIMCKKCQKPYNVDEDDDDDDDDGHLEGANVNDDNADISRNDQNSDFSGWIECPKCPNRTFDLFDITKREDGRIHKVKCMACGHGNTFHDPGSPLRRNTGAVQPCQGNLLSWGGSVWNALAAVFSAVAPSAQKSIQSAADQGLQQVARNLQNRRAAPQGLAQIGVRLVASVGEDVIVQLGNKFLRNVVSSTMTRNVAANFGEFIRNLAAVKLEETQKAKKRDQLQQQQQS